WRLPICSYSSAWRASASAVSTFAPLAKTTSAPARSCFFQAWMRVGWTPNCPASSLTVRSPLIAARATWALNAAVWCLRLPAIASPFLGHQCSLRSGPVFGVHYSHFRILGAQGSLWSYHPATADRTAITSGTILDDGLPLVARIPLTAPPDFLAAE